MGMHRKRPLATISDDELLRRLIELVNQSRRVEADLVAHISEIDERRLYAREAAPSMFAYCTEVLHLSEAEAYLRITVARTSREFPQVHEMLRDGRLHLSGIVRLAPHLNHANADGLLQRAAHRSKRQIEELIAEVAPRADAPAQMRKLPGRAPLASRIELVPDRVGTTEPRPEGVLPCTAVRPPEGPSVERPAVVEPLSADRYKVQFTGSKELCDKLERLRALMRHEVPGGDLVAIIEKAVSEKLARMEAKRHGAPARTRCSEAAPSAGTVLTPSIALTPSGPPTRSTSPTPSASSPPTRHIPAALRRVVWERDDHRCRYVDSQGRRCPERKYLEYHHRHPFAMGGDHGVENIRLMCHAHNAYLAEHDYGRRALARYRKVGGTRVS